MMKNRKVFLSFLGASNYHTCDYCFNGECIEDVKFVQEAIIKIFCKDFENRDEYIFFLTDKAEKQNWVNRIEVEKSVWINKISYLKDFAEKFSMSI